ncbi:hypothetical protein FB451DRAFT_1436690 [Mycena latifolia]|nr:hypothetical protein FB451DRAFT_1436690 [Mycena latifolia]
MQNSQDHSFQWTQYNISHGRPDIKEEVPEPFSLLSPPSSPSSLLTNSSSLSSRRRSTSGATSPKRARPYPSLPREIRSRIDQFEMATTPSLWGSSSRSGNSRANNENRRGSEGNQHPMYNSPYGSMPMYPNAGPSDSDEHRSPSSRGSSGTSSLTGAMGDAHVSARHSGSPPQFNMSTVGWQASMMPAQSSYPGVAGAMAAGPYLDPQASSYSSYRGSPQSLSPPSPFTTNFTNDSFRTHSTYPPATGNPTHPPLNPQEAEVHHLRKRVRELEQQHERQAKALESTSARRAYPAGGLPSPMSSPPTTANFQASWKARTEARIRQFCALNRAGNALCAWHDSRRERRVYPPRMAPDGYLNCGCTYEEALFEESLARHHVGSYLPGETVRMDPALRNPLLKLLETRYGYKDGDFERDPRTGDWVPGEGHAFWEQQIQAGAPSARQGRR